MSRSLARRAATTLVLLAALVAPATASAWTVTVHVHGAGMVDEITPRNLMLCVFGPTGFSNATVSDCAAGSQNGVYNSFDVVELEALVPFGHYNRGWRFSHWADSSEGGGKVNCDPQGGPGQPPATNCRFQVFENLEVDLYFIDIEGPQDTTIGAGGPAAGQTTNSTAAAFTFNSPSESADARYECRLDPPGPATGNYLDCGTPQDKGEDYPGLTENGQYTFSVRAKDPTGNVDNTPVQRTWTVDTVAPLASIAGNPAHGALTGDTAANLSASTEPGATLVCTFQGSSSPCSTTRTDLADGTYTFTARATDPAGNVGPTATRTWTVDADGPTVDLTGGPAQGSTVNQSVATFTWTAGEAATFQCSLGDASFAGCASGDSFSGLADGPKRFRLRATATGGRNLVTEVERTWTVDTAVPDTTLLSGPAEGSTTAQSEATFEFASPESGVAFECRLDGAPFAACASPLKLTGLTNADHVFEVRARDAAGNVDASPVRRAWRVNSLDADGDGVNAPADCDDANPAIKPGATDTPDDGIDQDCAGGDAKVVIPPDNDKDDDGVNAGLDCDDANPAVRPGATDVPRDGIDQDCVNGDAPFPVTSAGLSYNFKPRGANTRVARLVLSKIAVGATVKVACKGRGCPIRSKTVRPSTGTVDVRKLLKRKPLRAGNVVTLTITQAGHVGKVVSFRARRGKSPTGGVFRCLEPGATKSLAC